MSSFQFKVTSTPNPRLAWSNRVQVTAAMFANLAKAAASAGLTLSSTDPSVNLVIAGTRFVFQASAAEGLSDNELAMNQLQRKSGGFTLQQPIQASVFVPDASCALNGVTIGLDLITKKAGMPKQEFNVEELTASFKLQFVGQVFVVGQCLAMDFNGTKLDLVVEAFEHAELGVGSSSSAEKHHGQIIQMTNMSFKKQNGSQTNIVFAGLQAASTRTDLFRSDFDMEKMGIGGLDSEFKTMFRRAFGSRMFPGLVKQLGINHIRGILLYGPPGCGKTLIARQIGKILNAREPKIINGPEVLDKYVGASEEKIRALFVDAEKEQAEMGDASMLHIIIFDEMDAVMKTRGSTRDNTGVADSIVNQLLSKIDGVDSLNNILIIGMTNRLDMIDEAILRPGRLELHIEIGLPTEAGRLQIINIHTASMRKHNRITAEAIERLPELAAMSKNFTGAELEGMVRIAASFALARNTDPKKLTAVDERSVRVEWEDFERAVGECEPAYGNKDEGEIKGYYRNGIINYGPAYQDLWTKMMRLMSQLKTSERTPLISVLLEGPTGTGKTALAAKLCVDCELPFVRMISADTLMGVSEYEKCQRIVKCFNDSYRSPQSIIFIDDIERILEFAPVGPRFSNMVLQTLLVLIRKVPPKSRLMVIATTAMADRLEDLQLTQMFQVNLHVSQLQTTAEVQAVLSNVTTMSTAELRAVAATVTSPIGIKQLLLVNEMARADAEDNGTGVTPAVFLDCLNTMGF